MEGSTVGMRVGIGRCSRLMAVELDTMLIRGIAVGITYEDNRERVDYISMYHFRAHS